MRYYTEIENYIKKNEVNKKTRVLEENQDTLTNYWNIGRLLVKAQGGEKRAKYGNGLIKEWASKYTEKYGKGYDSTNLRKFRQLYLLFPNCATLSRTSLSWSQLVVLLPIQDENKRNYYINQCNAKNLSVRELRCEIKNNSYERLLDKPRNIEIVSIPKKETIVTNMKNPILLELKGGFLSNEHDLEVCILSQLKNFFTQLGNGFLFADNQYKITKNHHTYFIDILLFNVNFNCYVVVELKSRELRKEDKAQVMFYMELIDNELKKTFHNQTIGIIISKEQNKLIANFVSSENIIPLTYKIK